ncbi:serine/threonine protein kinase [Streptomyces sp. UNOB3_S3]|uniref:serine/threonine protein kinase n=1 Tax=Streptomyces sp. UNOB3_S3 TaxID=2871682 RepID=UPI001E54D752|nr:protein kinase [Streptomyces sp. UNOB3_S3]MCC3777574.1 protein kinase [Streptomyces sp. UNOB3_S3]
MRGKTLAGRYTLSERLASGSMGTVWTGLDAVLEREVAVKLLRPPVEDDATFAERFRSEATAMAKLNHPGIVSVYDYGHEPPAAGDTGEPTAFLVMELVAGESLDALLRREGALPPERALDLAVQVVEALRAAHEAGIVHRDVKPSNLLLRDGRILVADFGIALPDFSPRLTASGTRLGTAPYQAPEQAARGRVTPAADLYSVGVVLHEMLAGQVPFDGGTAFEITLKHLTEPPPELPDDIPVPVREVVRRALSKAPEERWESAAAMAAELASVRDAVSVYASYASSVTASTPVTASASVVSPASAPKSLTGMRRARVGALVAVCIVAAGATAVAVPLTLRDGGERHARATAEDAGNARPGASPAAPRALAAPAAAPAASPSASSGHPGTGPTSTGSMPSALSGASGGATPDMSRPSSPGGYTLLPGPAVPGQSHRKGTGDGTGGDSRSGAGRPAPGTSKDPDPANPDPAKPTPSKPDPSKPAPPVPPALPAKVQWRNGFTALDNDNSRDIDGNRVGTWDINASEAQQWRPTKYGDGSYTFTNLATKGKVLDMRHEDRMAQIWGTPQGAAANQRWRVVPEGTGYRLINMENEECLTTNGLHSLAYISQCNGGAGQLWTAVDADSYPTENSRP